MNKLMILSAAAHNAGMERLLRKRMEVLARKARASKPKGVNQGFKYRFNGGKTNVAR